MPLQLLQVLPSRRTKNRVWLLFSNKTKIPFSLDDLVFLSLKSNTEITPKIYEKIKSTSLFYLLYNYSLNQIALSPKIRQILLPKLKQKLFFYGRKYKIDGDYSSLIDEILDKLDSLSLIDESAFADYLLRKNQHRSRLYLQKLFSLYKLRLPLNYSYDDSNKITQILLKKTRTQNLSDPSAKNKIINSLLRKGFAYSDIKISIDEFTKNR